MTVGVLVMAHGTPANTEEIEAFYTRIRRGRPPEPAQLAELTGRYDAIGGTSPLAARTRAQVDALRRRARPTGAGPLSRQLRGQAHRPPARGRGRRAGRVGRGGRDRTRPHPARVLHGFGRVPRAGASARWATHPFTAITSWYDNPSFVRLMAQRVRAAVADVHRALPASSSPRTRSPNGCGPPATPTPTNSRSRPGWSPPRPASPTGWSPGRAPAAPPSRGSVPTSATRCGGWPPRARPTPSWCAPSASSPTTSRCSTTSTSNWRQWPPPWAWPTPARHR